MATLAAVVDREQAQQVGHFEGLDTKAGLLLGFAGLLISLAPDCHPVFRVTGGAVGVLAASCALMAMRPRRFQMLDLHAIRVAAGREPAFNPWDIVDTQVENWRHNQSQIERKTRWLRAGVVLLFLTIALYGLGTLASMIGDW